MRSRWPASKGGPQGEAATELGRLMAQEEVDSGRLVRTLARAVVHVPMPDAPAEKAPRPAGPEDGDVPLFVVEDEDGRHAFVYSSPQALVDAWRSNRRITAAAVPLRTLLARWPAGTDLVVDAGLPQARQIPMELLRQVALDAAGVPTAAGVALSDEGYDVELPDPEPVQVIGATRAVADTLPEVVAMSRAITRDHEPLAREVLTLVVEFAPGTERASIDAAMQQLAAAIAGADPDPVRLVAAHDGADQANQELIDRVCAADSPYWSRTVGS